MDGTWTLVELLDVKEPGPPNSPYNCIGPVQHRAHLENELKYQTQDKQQRNSCLCNIARAQLEHKEQLYKI